jgi:hypothetical protein
LGQNPKKVPIASEPDVLGTVVKHCGIMFADHPEANINDNHPGRWFCPRELLLTQAVPSYNYILKLMGIRRKLCSFNFSREDFGHPERLSLIFGLSVGTSRCLHNIMCNSDYDSTTFPFSSCGPNALIPRP